MRNSILTLLIAGTVTLAGCGGGGGGNVRPSGDGFAPRTVSDAYSADPGRTRTAAARVASSLPRFGSVTQSTNRGVSGVTTDAASTTFDGRNVSLAVARQDGSRLRLDSATHAVPDFTTDWTSPIGNHTGRTWGLLDYTNSTVTVGLTAVSWNNSDPTDYLAGGYWMYVTGDFSAPRVTGIEVGAFVDGPELDGPARVPTLGTATYTGAASGLYAYEYGSGHSEVPDGTVEVGSYDAVATLNADFGAGTIAGCIGCVGAVTVSGVASAPDGRAAGFEGVETYARVRMAPAAIGSDGTFRNRDVSVELLGRTVTSSSGSWGGKFSNIEDSAGDPRLVAGTNGAEWNESDGSQGVLTGAFFGTK